jgi:hypothetical protein
MEIGSVGAVPNRVPVSQIHQSERTERGPDRDNDGDEGKKVTTSSAQSTAVSGRGSSINIIA